MPLKSNSSEAPMVSIIMPTLNSERVIELSLSALERQDYPKGKIEILVIDGGSTDRTRTIAKKFGARVINNPKVQPEHAISIGLRVAKGKYAILLGSDEVIQSKSSISKKVKLLAENPDCKNITTSGLVSPEEYPFITSYINRYGEPFSHFIYNLDGGDYFASLRARYTIAKETKDYEILKFRPGDLTPIVDGGGHLFDLKYLRSIEDVKSRDLPARIFSSMVSNSHLLGVLRDDYITHYSTSSIRGYLKKIKWRIVSNLSKGKKDIPGYKNREKYLDNSLKFKKYLFIPYALSLVLPLLDSIIMAIKHRDVRYMIHLPLTLYTAFELIFQVVKTSFFRRSEGAGAYG